MVGPASFASWCASFGDGVSGAGLADGEGTDPDDPEDAGRAAAIDRDHHKVALNPGDAPQTGRTEVLLHACRRGADRALVNTVAHTRGRERLGAGPCCLRGGRAKRHCRQMPSHRRQQHCRE